MYYKATVTFYNGRIHYLEANTKEMIKSKINRFKEYYGDMILDIVVDEIKRIKI